MQVGYLFRCTGVSEALRLGRAVPVWACVTHHARYHPLWREDAVYGTPAPQKPRRTALPHFFSPVGKIFP